MAIVELKNVKKSYGNVDVIHGVDLSIGHGEFCVFVGPSGCGKSTLLRMIAGLEEISSGEMAIDGVVVNDVDPSKRGVAMVFQNYALYPHMTVRENMSFGLRMARRPAAEITEQVDNASRILQLDALMDRKPGQLSGGQRQRVAIGRSIVRNPKVFLFDEPLSNLDAELRVTMRVEISKLHQQLGNTMIYVTHDQTEAMTLADKIVVLRSGKIEQAGSPLELYENPANQFVAGFIGSPRMNFISVETTNNAIRFAGTEIPLPQQLSRLPKGSKLQMGIRPEHFDRDNNVDLQLTGTVDVLEQLGGTSFIYAKTSTGESLVIERRDRPVEKVGEPIKVGFKIEDVRFFDGNGARLSV